MFIPEVSEMAEYCDFEWTGYRIPHSPSSAPYTPTKEVPLEKEEALKLLQMKVSACQGTAPNKVFWLSYTSMSIKGL